MRRSNPTVDDLLGQFEGVFAADEAAEQRARLRAGAVTAAVDGLIERGNTGEARELIQKAGFGAELGPKPARLLLGRIAKSERDNAKNAARQSGKANTVAVADLDFRVATGQAFPEELDLEFEEGTISAAEYADFLAELKRFDVDSARRADGASRVQGKLANGEKPDAGDPAERAAVEELFDDLAEANAGRPPEERAIIETRFVRRTGMLPAALSDSLTAGMLSEDPAAQVAAAGRLADISWLSDRVVVRQAASGGGPRPSLGSHQRDGNTPGTEDFRSHDLQGARGMSFLAPKTPKPMPSFSPPLGGTAIEDAGSQRRRAIRMRIGRRASTLLTDSSLAKPVGERTETREGGRPAATQGPQSKKKEAAETKEDGRQTARTREGYRGSTILTGSLTKPIGEGTETREERRQAARTREERRGSTLLTGSSLARPIGEGTETREGGRQAARTREGHRGSTILTGASLARPIGEGTETREGGRPAATKGPQLAAVKKKKVRPPTLSPVIRDELFDELDFDPKGPTELARIRHEKVPPISNLRYNTVA